MSKPSPLLNKLQSAFDKDAPTPQESTVRSAGTLVSPKPPKTTGRAEKITATIYATDWKRLDEIKDYFRQAGYRNMSDSEAFRTALRAVPINNELILYYENMRKEDLRRKTA